MITPMGPASEALGYLALGVAIVGFKKITDGFWGALIAFASKRYKPGR